MKYFIDKTKTYIQLHPDSILLLSSFCISCVAIIYFILRGNQNLADYDAIARLNIARKMLDSITPGIGQLGGVWLPFPQVLLLLFVWNNTLWHTGLAGSIISGVAFIIGAVYLEKTALLLTKSRIISLFVWLMFVTNANILLLQTMAMSESFFLFSLIMTLYFLTKWTIVHDIVDFLLAAFFIILLTLTRYEGYFIFIGALVTVSFESSRNYWHNGGRTKIEGMILLFLTVASYGIFLWCIYCALFYKDPFYWLHLYSSGQEQVSTAVKSIEENHKITQIVPQTSFIAAFKAYTGAILWTNGIITTAIGLLGEVLLIYTVIKQAINKQTTGMYISIVVMSLVLFGFLIYGYQKGFIPEIEYPPLTLQHILNKSFNDYSHSNIRYGIILAPFIFLLAGFAAAKNRILQIIVMLLFAFQLFTNFYTPLFLFFSFPKSWHYTVLTSASWFASHYDGGLILISANKHENFMFQTGLPYKDFIYEGTRNYWITSLKNPATYATWVIFDKSLPGDKVTYYLTGNGHDILTTQFTHMYDIDDFEIYRIRNQ